jgi:hypothetical protein
MKPRGPADPDDPDDRSDGPADAERDAWLREALRHAPDSAAAPPPALREAILARARAATGAHRSASAPGRRPTGAATANPFVAFWDWLARPPIASGFAGVLAATLVGLVWWDRPMDEALPRPPSASVDGARAPQPSTALSSAPTPGAVPRPAPGAAAERAARAQDRTAGQTSGDESASAFPSLEKTERAAADAGPAAKAAPSRLVTPASPPAGTVSGRSDSMAADRLREPGAASGAGPEVEAERRASAQAPPAMERNDPAEPATRDAVAPLGAALAKRDGVAKRDPLAKRDALAQLGAAPLASVRGSIAAEAPRWSRRTTGAQAAVDDAAQRWLAAVDAAVAGRWQPLADADASLAAAPAEAGSGALLVLNRDGQPAALVRIDGRSVTLESRLDGRARRWQATLEESAARRLPSTLPR